MPNPFNVDIKYGNSEKALSSVNYSLNPISVSIESMNTTKASETIKNSSGIEKMILLSDSEIFDVAIDVLSGKYSTGDNRKKLLAAAGYDVDAIQDKVNELLPAYLLVKEALEKNYSKDELNKLVKEKGLNPDNVEKILNLLNSNPNNLTELEELKKEKIDLKRMEQESAIETLSDVVNKFSDLGKPYKTIFNSQNDEKLNELSNNIVQTAIDEKTNHNNLSSYMSGQWCANFATWVWKNSSVDGKSAYEIARLNSTMTSSTGNLMMHFLTADHPDLGFDYTNCVYYDPEVNKNIAFYYNDLNPDMAGRNSSKLAEGLKNYVPKAGDIVFFDNCSDQYGSAGHAELWNPLKNPNDSRQDHTGMVKEVKFDAEGNVTGIVTIEGNISNWFYERTINFFDEKGNFNYNDVYSSGLIGYGTVINYPIN